MTPDQALQHEAAFIAQRAKKDGKPDPEAQMRLMSYASKDLNIHGTHDYRCPRCWITQGKRSPLSPRPGTGEYDLFGCHACGSEVEVPFDR